MNVEIAAEAALFPEKEYINGIAVALYIEEFQNIIMASERSFREGGMLQRVIGAIFFVCVI